MKYTFLLVLGAVGSLAGPPLICHPVDIGNARSLPWIDLKNWNGADPHYDVNGRLVPDTLAILAPSAPLALRMETIRRAAIYAVKNEALAENLSARLTARIADTEAGAKPDPNAWFDAGYYAEAVRQLGFLSRYLPASATADWKIHNDTRGLDGRPWIEKGIRLGGKGMEVALAKIDEYRQADLKRTAALVSAVK